MRRQSGAGCRACLADPRREDAARDQYRHPAETLAFFGVEPGMTVVDYMPNGWWYTRILVPYLGKDGDYIGMNPDVSRETGYMKNSYDDARRCTGGRTCRNGPARATRKFPASMPTRYPEALDGTVDRVLIFREMHNHVPLWLAARTILLIVRKMLKPGGLVGRDRPPRRRKCALTNDRRQQGLLCAKAT